MLDEARETMALPRILTISEHEVAAGKAIPVTDVIARFTNPIAWSLGMRMPGSHTTASNIAPCRICLVN
jgi:hypothetical protein